MVLWWLMPISVVWLARRATSGLAGAPKERRRRLLEFVSVPLAMAVLLYLIPVVNLALFGPICAEGAPCDYQKFDADRFLVAELMLGALATVLVWLPALVWVGARVLQERVLRADHAQFLP